MSSCKSQNPVFVIGVPTSFKSFALHKNIVNGRIAGAVHLAPNARIRLEDVSFDETDGQPGNELYLGTNAAAYVAAPRPSNVINSYDVAGDGSINPLSDAPNGAEWPAEDDAAFVEIRQVRVAVFCHLSWCLCLPSNYQAMFNLAAATLPWCYAVCSNTVRTLWHT